MEHQTKMVNLFQMAVKADNAEWLNEVESKHISSIGDDRRTGKTRFISSYALATSLLSCDRTCAIVVHNNSMVSMVRNYIKEMLDATLLTETTMRSTINMFEFKNGSKIILVSSVNNLRGWCLSTLIFDEAALIENKMDAIPCISKAGKVIITNGGFE